MVKISQFEFLVTTEQNILLYKLFLSLNIPDFSLFFVEKLQPPWKVTPLFPATPSKNWVPVKPHPFQNLMCSSTTPCQQKQEVHTLFSINRGLKYPLHLLVLGSFPILSSWSASLKYTVNSSPAHWSSYDVPLWRPNIRFKWVYQVESSGNGSKTPKNSSNRIVKDNYTITVTIKQVKLKWGRKHQKPGTTRANQVRKLSK